MKKQQKTPVAMTTKIIIVLVLLFLLFSFASCTAVMLSLSSGKTGSSIGGNVAVVPISGVIVSQADGWGSDVADADTIVSWLEEARDDTSVNAVILEINSPGGSPVASDEIGQAIKDLRDENKTVVAWIREVGASGGYWVASASDHIIANRMSVTGSIGVIGSYFGFEEAMDEWNITYRRFVGGEKKDTGTPFRKMSDAEQVFLQDKVDKIHEVFVQEVAANRGMTEDEVWKLATGEYYLGLEAIDNGLIDELGGLDEALAYIEEAKDIKADPFWYEKQVSLYDLFSMRVTHELATPQMGMELR